LEWALLDGPLNPSGSDALDANGKSLNRTTNLALDGLQIWAMQALGFSSYLSANTTEVFFLTTIGVGVPLASFFITNITFICHDSIPTGKKLLVHYHISFILGFLLEQAMF